MVVEKESTGLFETVGSEAVIVAYARYFSVESLAVCVQGTGRTNLGALWAVFEVHC
jgi:hypothetical protein